MHIDTLHHESNTYSAGRVCAHHLCQRFRASADITSQTHTPPAECMPTTYVKYSVLPPTSKSLCFLLQREARLQYILKVHLQRLKTHTHKHGWIAQVIKSLYFVVPGPGVDPGSPREFVKTGTYL